MKRHMILAATILLAWSGGHAGNRYSDDPRFTDEKLQLIERSLQDALESGNFGMQTSAAQVVRDVKALVPRYAFSSLVIPLMRILKDEDATPAKRILAALALHDLGSERGNFAIRRVGEFTDIKLLKHICVWLSYEQLSQKHQTDSASIIAGRTR